MIEQIITLSEPSLRVLLSYLEDNMSSFKKRLAGRVDAIPGLKQTVSRLQGHDASVDETYLQAQEYLSSDPCDRRALDIWFDYRKAREYCIAQWQEWETTTSKTGTITRINVLGLWQVCASLTAAEVGEIPILPHIDRLVWYLAHLLDDIVDVRAPNASRLPREKLNGIVRTLRVLCELNMPKCSESVSGYYHRFKHDFLAHLPHSMPEKPLVEQLYHKLIPDTITASIYNDIMELIVGDKFDVERTKHAMREAMYVWQVLDDLTDYDRDIREGVANISLMCLEQTGEELPQSAAWPAADQVPCLLPKTVALLRQVFQLLCQWLKVNRPDVLKFLFTEFGRVYPEEWHYILNCGQD